MSIKCPKCQAENPDTQRFCGDCGTQLKSAYVETRTLRTTAKDSTVGEIVSEKYKLLEELGSGGMGIVYKAEQIKPVKRSVALKIIKLGMDTRQVVARFETERQALAVMDHPNIAKVFDGGATEIGRPYFVMELVRGVPITEYCDKHKLTTKERLELFIHVCQAVQHAHQKGVIHRDLKPSNILVVVQEDMPIPKIIDFGIAKATEHSLTQRTLFTEQGQLIGTPEYMSPEQAEMSGLDVDTRTDIYSLGVILYELLVGVLPFDPKILRKAGFGEIQRIIRETDPPKASTRLSGLGDNQKSITQHRKTDMASLHRELKGDLDWITMKAMAKDRTHRYATASEMVFDIERYLRHEPVLAGPPSKIYRVKKYIKRHKIGVMATLLVALTLLIGIAGTTVGLVKAINAERIARAAEDKAKEEAETAKQTLAFLVNLFKVSDPREARGSTITAREILEKGVGNIKDSLKDQPEVQARLLLTFGEVYTSLGLYKQAKPLIESAVQIRRSILGSEHLETLAASHALANLYWHLKQLDNAENLYIKVVEAYEKQLGKEHQKTLRAKYDLASVYVLIKDRYDEMEQLSLEILETQRRILGESHIDTLDTMHNLAHLYYKQERFKEAESINIKVLNGTRYTLGEDHPDTLYTMHNLATVYEKQEKYDQAEALFIKTIEIKQRVEGEIHPSTIHSIKVLASMYQKQGRYIDAEALLINTLNKLDTSLGEQHIQTNEEIIKELFDLYTAWGKAKKAAEYHRLLKNEREE